MVAGLLPKEARMQLDVHKETDLVFLEALKALGKPEECKIIDGEAQEIEKVPALPKKPESG